MSSAEACRQEYLTDLAAQSHCCSLTHITDEHRTANKNVFEILMKYQLQVDQHGSLPFTPNTEERVKKNKAASNGINYPEHLLVVQPRELRQILPIPDIHKVSDCDTIYRYLIARRMDVKLAAQDVLHYIAFREKYDLDHILWDREVESLLNGLDGEELLMDVMRELAAAQASQKKSSKKEVKPSRPLLQPGLAAWNVGVSKCGHVVYYERPAPKDLVALLKRYPYVENQGDHRHPDFHAVTPPYSNLLIRARLRTMEKGRRLSRLLNYQQQYLLREVFRAKLPLSCNNGSAGASTFMDTGGGIVCVIDVGLVRMRYVTSRKYKDVFKMIRLLSLMGQFHYPENLKHLIVVNGGFVFNLLYKVVKPWLDEQTQAKVIVMTGTSTRAATDLPAAETPAMKTPVTDNASDDESESDASCAQPDEKANSALRQALGEFLPNRFIPASYGGDLAMKEAPQWYGGGAPPKHLAQNPYFSEASRLVQGKVLPELMTDDWLLSNTVEGQPVGDAEWKAFCEEMTNRMCQ